MMDVEMKLIITAIVITFSCALLSKASEELGEDSWEEVFSFISGASFFSIPVILIYWIWS